jgi:transcriptional regulator with XRE-family HTH domain
LRKAKKLSQDELAEILSYKKGASISNIELGKNPPDFNALSKIADVLNADLHWLITGNPSPAIKELKNQLRMYGKALISSLCSEIFYLDCELFDIQNKETSPRRDKELNWFHNRLKEKRTQLKQIQDELETLFGADFTKSIIESMIDKK